MIKSYVPRFLYVPHSHQNLRPGDTAANIPNLMKHIISTALAVLALFILSENAAAQKRIVINSEPAGAEVYVNGIPTNQPPPQCSRIREEKLSPSGSERKDTKTANCLS